MTEHDSRDQQRTVVNTFFSSNDCFHMTECVRLPLEVESAGSVPLPMLFTKPRLQGCLLPDGQVFAAALRLGETPVLQSLFKSEAPSDPLAKQSPPPSDAHHPTSRTRIRPPADVLKLEDRLHYLLQPPLEMLLSSGSLNFPFKPFSYQLEGIAYLLPRSEAVLADEMGLGKTMQAITSIRLLAKMGEVRRVLLICPKPVLTNWQREFALWAPELPVAIVSGSKPRRDLRWNGMEPGVSIANFELIVRDLDTIAATPLPYDLMVIDEAQRIKNDSSVTNKAICKVPRRRSWALTGTPIENSTDDIVGIFNFVSPKLLYKGMKARAISKAVGDHVLRRTKDDVQLDLPPKMIRDAAVSLSPEQQSTYTLAEEEGIVRLNAMGSELTIQHVFQLVLRLKQICNFDPVTGASSKLDSLMEDLEDCAASGRKAIIFSQWVNTIHKLEKRLSRFHPESYHGKIPSSKRDAILQKFKLDPKCHVLLMSYGAGSVGLNLQFASYVFLFDRWWNPAVEDQAINRAHRIGSAGPVTVTRFLSVGTIEERIDQILLQKRELFNSIFGNDDWQGSGIGLTQREVMGLLGLEPISNTKAA